MVAFYLLQSCLLAALFYLLWRLFGREIFHRMTDEPELEVRRKLDRVRERLASLPTAEEIESSAMPSGPVEFLRAEYSREERELLIRLEHLRAD